MKHHIFLLGYMGSGKTTLGKKLANRLNRPFIDVDAQLELQFGCSIADFFAAHGELAFRREEQRMLHKLHEEKLAVISLGGGLPCFENNMEVILQLGTSIYLKRSPGELAQRLAKNKAKRPLIAHLDDEELRDFIKNHLVEREPFYNKASYIAPRNKQTVDELAVIILTSAC